MKSAAEFAVLLFVLAALSHFIGATSASKSVIAYRWRSAKDIHDVQEDEDRLHVALFGLVLFVALQARAEIWWEYAAALGLAAIGAYAAYQFQNFRFQVGINRGAGKPRIDPDEDPTWTSPRRDGKEMTKWGFYGRRRRWQRWIAGVVLALCAIAYAALW